jgi:hypothetical protein
MWNNPSFNLRSQATMIMHTSFNERNFVMLAILKPESSKNDASSHSSFDVNG